MGTRQAARDWYHSRRGCRSDPSRIRYSRCTGRNTGIRGVGCRYPQLYLRSQSARRYAGGGSHMNVFVFTGPTLSPTEAEPLLEARYLPPVKQGDVYRVTLKPPVAIGIIDGFFEHVPSVWHKEILWAMTQGIHVFGSASMGALRAAELDAFGMQGVGKIFEDYRRGNPEDDDHVAVTHGPAQAQYPVFSEAMVNIRATVARAVAEGVFGEEAGGALVGIAKALFYPERRYQLILQHAFEQGAVPPGELDAFRRWLPTGKIDQKGEDARAMLTVMHTQLEKGVEPKRIWFVFAHTDVWDNLTTQFVSLS